MPDQRLRSLDRAFRWLVASVILLFLVAVAIAVFAYVENGYRAAEGQQAKKGLCRVRAERIDQVAQSDAFLAKHPHGIPGIPASLIRQGRATAQATVAALAPLHCPPAERSSR